MTLRYFACRAMGRHKLQQASYQTEKPEGRVTMLVWFCPNCMSVVAHHPMQTFMLKSSYGQMDADTARAVSEWSKNWTPDS